MAHGFHDSPSSDQEQHTSPYRAHPTFRTWGPEFLGLYIASSVPPTIVSHKNNTVASFELIINEDCVMLRYCRFI